MQEAREKLEEAKRRDAGEKQVEAIKELEEAKAELEEILRQLREEEMSRTLAMLETRFRKMLDAQVEVYEGTRRLDQVDGGAGAIATTRLKRAAWAARSRRLRPKPTRPWSYCAKKVRPWPFPRRSKRCATT